MSKEIKRDYDYLFLAVKGEAKDFLKSEAKRLDRKPVWIVEQMLLANKKQPFKNIIMKKTLAILIFASLLYSCSSVTQPQSNSISGTWYETGAAWFKSAPADSIWSIDLLTDSCLVIFIDKSNYGPTSAGTVPATITGDSVSVEMNGLQGAGMWLGLHGDSLVGSYQGTPVSFGR
jgi:hypothetical protein